MDEEKAREGETHKLTVHNDAMDLSMGSPSIQRVLATSILSGFCLLVPVPFLDDYLLRKLTNSMIRKQLSVHNVELPKKTSKQLLEDPSGKGILAYVFGAGLYVVKKIFRKLVYVLAVKDSVDVASRVFHKGWLLEVALMRGWLTSSSVTSEADVHIFQKAVQATCNAVDPRPINHVFRRLFMDRTKRVHKASKAFSEELRKAAEDASKGDSEEILDNLMSQGGVEGITNDVEEVFAQETKYLHEVANTFEVFLRAGGFGGV